MAGGWRPNSLDNRGGRTFFKGRNPVVALITNLSLRVCRWESMADGSDFVSSDTFREKWLLGSYWIVLMMER